MNERKVTKAKRTLDQSTTRWTLMLDTLHGFTSASAAVAGDVITDVIAIDAMVVMTTTESAPWRLSSALTVDRIASKCFHFFVRVSTCSPADGINQCKGAITSKIKHAIKHKTSPARLAQLLQPSLAFCCSLQPTRTVQSRTVRRHWLQAKTKC